MNNYQYTLLFVDDEQSILNSLRRTFRNDNYNILLANNGPKGLKLLQDHEVSVIISDQRMPGMSGSQFLAQSKITAPHAVRILLTGYSDIEDAVQSINEGQIFRYLSKPWSEIDLKYTVLQALIFHDLSRHSGMLAEDLKRKNQALEIEVKRLQRGSLDSSTTRKIQDLETENAHLRKKLGQRDRLLRIWQQQLDQVLNQTE